jgi:large subunit ribosomal protein L36e
MARTKVPSGLFVGMNKGHIVTKTEQHPNTFKKNKSLRKGRIHPRVTAVREVITEVCGLAPFQRRMLELIRTGEAKAEKKAMR